MASYRKVKGGYQTVVRIKGYRQVTKVFRRKTDAKKWADGVEDDMKRGQYLPEAGRMTLTDLIERYIKDVLPSHKDGDKTARQLGWWEQHLGGLKLEQIHSPRIIDLREELLNGVTRLGKQRSPATVNRYLAALSACLSYAVNELQWLSENPVKRVKKKTESKGRDRFLDDSELERLTGACRDSDNPILYVLFMVALSSGARQSEIMRLCWGDVNLQAGSAVIQESKNSERRSIPIKGVALDALREYAISQSRGGADRVFPGPFPRKAWNRALEVAGVENFHWHDIRHTTASYLAMSGCTLLEIAEILGHKTLAMVQRYAHLTEKHSHGKVEDMMIRKGLG